MLAVKLMKWDEDIFGLEYGLAPFNIVAVPDFEYGMTLEAKTAFGIVTWHSWQYLKGLETITNSPFDFRSGLIG